MFSDVRSAFVVSKNVLCYTVSKNVNRVVGFMFNQLTESDIKKMEEEIEENFDSVFDYVYEK